MNDNTANKWQDLSEKSENEAVEEAQSAKETEDLNEILEGGSDQGQTEEPALDIETSEYQQQLAALEKKSQENWDKAVRATAELENVRRRAKLDVENAHKFGKDKFAEALLPVIDSLEQALMAEQSESDVKEVQAMREGIDLTLKLFLDVLAKYEIKQLDPVGELFDPNCHEAISMMPDDSVKPNTVLTVFQKGYLLHNRVIRPARVIVSKAP